MELQALKDELARFGADNDATHATRAQRMLNITADTGALLGVLVRATGARRVLEIGTSNGYSTLWLAEAAAAVDGRVTTLDYAADKVALARTTFQRSGLGAYIALVHADAGAWLHGAADASVDLLFLDSERSQYLGWWPDLRRVLRPGGLLVVDNAVSHAQQMAAFEAQVRCDPQFTSVRVPIGNGELIAVRSAA
ncbi:class I SAM-dependent methyltransferase [Bacillus subtilis subsp. subtilis]|nr:class I SAM-dependent methyltransferase [Bacillus subtilis subsp. subtilis]